MNSKLWLAHFGSLRSTLVLLALLGAVVLAGTTLAAPLAAPLLVVMAALAVNLLAALVVHPAFRRQPALLVAHVALLLLAMLAGAGRLLSLDGHFELTEGVPFEGRLLDQRAGALHHADLQALRFSHQGFEIDYAPGRKRGPTRNQVTWVGEDQQVHRGVIGDHHPLVLQGWRIYTSPNKGFAPLLQWRPAQGPAVRGAVHLPSYPMHELRQAREWQLPDGRAVWVMLQIDETLIDPQAAAHFRLPAEHRLVLRVGEQRFELAPGQAAELPGGTLVYEGLRSWMGYRVAYDPTLPWLLAAAVLASLALGLHYVTKFRGARSPRAVVLNIQREVADA